VRWFKKKRWGGKVRVVRAPDSESNFKVECVNGRRKDWICLPSDYPINEHPLTYPYFKTLSEAVEHADKMYMEMFAPPVGASCNDVVAE